VRKSIGAALYDAQKGEKAPTAKPFRSIGSRVFDVLHAFQKKSKHGIKTPRQDLEVIEKRYRQALKMKMEKES